jgi:hypothetical protein
MAHRAPAKIDFPYPTVDEVARTYGISARRVARVVALVDNFLRQQKAGKSRPKKSGRRRAARSRK